MIELRPSACKRHVFIVPFASSPFGCVDRATQQARTSLQQFFVHPIAHALSLVVSHHSRNMIAE